MNGNCHFVFAGACASMAALNLDKLAELGLNIENTSASVTLIVMGGLIGGIVPDIDNPKFHMGQLSKPLSTIIGAIGRITGKTGTHHRDMFHDMTLYIIGLLLSYLYFPPLLGFWLGDISHLFLDAFNPMGVSLFLGAKTLHLGKINSNSKGSVIFTWVVTLIVISTDVIIKTTYGKYNLH